MGNRVWTKNQNLAITLHGQSVLVSAAAGSGKSSVLTERVIRDLLDKEHPKDITRMLVVTFTRSAAFELKAKISAALTRELSLHPGDETLSRQLLRIGSAPISTIDSFFLNTVRAHFDLLGIPSDFRLSDGGETQTVKDELIADLVEEFYHGSDASADFFRDQFAASMNHLMSDRNDGSLARSLQEIIGEITEKADGLTRFRAFSEQLRVCAEGDFDASRYAAVLKERLSTDFLQWIDTLERFERDIRAENGDTVPCSDTLDPDLSYCRAMAHALDHLPYGADLTAVANSFIRGSFSRAKNKTVTVQRYQAWRKDFKSEIERVQFLLSFSVSDLREQARALADLTAILVDFISEYQRRLLAEKKRRGVFEFADIPAMMLELLTRDEIVAELSDAFDDVYVDEYQDVDEVQDEIFRRIGKDHLFMVGDIKQSIYGFRGSEPDSFAAHRREMPLCTDENPPRSECGISVFMSENFRCDDPIIRFTNAVCPFLFRAASERSVGYRPEDDLVCAKRMPESSPAGHPLPVRVELFEKSPAGVETDPEAEWTADEIARLLRPERGECLDDGSPIRSGDIAVLVRTKKQAKPLLRALKERGVAAVSETDGIWENPTSTDLCNLLRAIDNPHRDIPFSEYLLSPFGGFTLDEITAIRGDSSAKSFSLYDSLCRTAKEEPNTPTGEKAAVCVARLAAWQETASALPADRFLRLLYAEEPFRAYAGTPVFLFFYEQARLSQKSGFCGLYDFLSRVDAARESKEKSRGDFQGAADAVRVMTIHHSKGLEFPIVFCYAMGAPASSGSNRSYVYHRKIGFGAKLYRADSFRKNDTFFDSLIGDCKEDDEREEEIRLLYVALTRARERLYLTGIVSTSKDNHYETVASGIVAARRSVLSSKSSLARVLAALDKIPTAGREDLPWVKTFHKFEATEEPTADLPAPPTETPTPIPLPTDPFLARFSAVAERQREFVYPFDILRDLPVKIAASKIRPDLLDALIRAGDQNAEEEGAIREQIELMRAAMPDFENLLLTDKTPDAAEIGSATHAFLEFCDFSRLFSDGVDAECRRLLDAAFLSEETAKIVNRALLEKFRRSPLMQTVLSAKEVRREQRFGLHLPMREMTRDPALCERLGDHTIFVQGSIDLLIRTERDELFLIDYKTDRLSDAERGDRTLLAKVFADRHGDQLRCYVRAVESLFGARPDRVFIYSLPLGDTVEIPL